MTLGADEELPTHASVPSAFDYILMFSFCLLVCLSLSYKKMGEKDSELLRPRPQAASDSEEMFETQTRREEVAAGAHAEIKAHK